jgi:hypothetical protein
MAVLGWHAFAIIQTFHGLGKHMWDVDPASLSVWFKVNMFTPLPHDTENVSVLGSWT